MSHVIRKPVLYHMPTTRGSLVLYHLSAMDMLKSGVIEEKSLQILNLSDLDQGQ